MDPEGSVVQTRPFRVGPAPFFERIRSGFLEFRAHRPRVAPADRCPLLGEGGEPAAVHCGLLASCSTPTRSCSEELLRRSTLADSASEDLVTWDKTAPATGSTLAAEQEESSSSPQCINAPSPSRFPAGSNGTATAGTSQRGTARSESEAPRAGASRTGCSLRGT